MASLSRFWPITVQARPRRFDATSRSSELLVPLPLASPEIQRLADECFAHLKRDPRHPSLRFKRVGPFRSARVGRSHRVLGLDTQDGIIWFWIGPHDEYDRLIDVGQIPQL
jgi:hypothetical protein